MNLHWWVDVDESSLKSQYWHIKIDIPRMTNSYWWIYPIKLILPNLPNRLLWMNLHWWVNINNCTQELILTNLPLLVHINELTPMGQCQWIYPIKLILINLPQWVHINKSTLMGQYQWIHTNCLILMYLYQLYHVNIDESIPANWYWWLYSSWYQPI